MEPTNNKAQAKQTNTKQFEFPVQLDGPYHPSQKDESFDKMMKLNEYKQMMKLEKAISLNTLFETDIKKEYQAVNNLMGWGDNYDQRSEVGNYKIIDASYIKTPFQESKEGEAFGMIVATDGYEMDNGLNEFWNIVVQTNVQTIIALNEHFTESYQFGVSKYFPADNKTDLTAGNFQITNLVKKMVKTKDSTLRFFEIRNKDKKLIKTISHIHFHAWDDFSVPDADRLKDLMQILEQSADMLIEEHYYMKTIKGYDPKKVLIHCLAGRGRTGTAISIINALITIKIQIEQIGKNANIVYGDEVKLSIFSIVRRLRMQRATSVQAKSQYLFIKSFIQEWFNTKFQINNQ